MPLLIAKRNPDSQDGLPFDASLRIKRRAAIGADALSIEDRHLNQGLEEAAGLPDHPDVSRLVDCAEKASTLLKAMGHDGRLTILCHLRTGPKSVTELENLLSARQAIVSQQLARLRLEGLVSARREGQAIFYSLLDPKVTAIIELLAQLYDVVEHG